MPEDMQVQHEGRLSTLEAKTDALHSRFDDLTISVTGLATQVQILTLTLEKYKWFMLAVVILLGMDNKMVNAIIEKLFKVVF
jgi:hypothetical protein